MSALDQYLKLFINNREAIEKNSPAILNRLRDEAFARLELSGTRLPRIGDDSYDRTSLDRLFEPDYGVNIGRLNMPVDIAAAFRCGAGPLTPYTTFVVNDIFVEPDNLKRQLPEGVRVMSLRRAAEEIPDVLERHLGRIAPMTHAAVALNTLLLQDGVVVYVEHGVHCEKPLQLINILSSTVDMLTLRRVLVVVEEDSEVQLLCCDHTQTLNRHFLISNVIEVFLSRGAKFDLYDLEESSEQTSRLWQAFVSQSEGSRFISNVSTLICGTTRNELNVDLNGEHAETRLNGMAIANGHMHVDNSTDVNHNVGRCRSNQLYKYVVTDDAEGAFEGNIYVAEGAKYTDAYQTNRNILASVGARMHTKPQLEIYNDDVKCSHGATTGQLDRNALFYMETRGIPEEEARTMLMQAFMMDVVDSVGIESLRQRLRHLVERKFNGGDMCDSCMGLNSSQQ